MKKLSLFMILTMIGTMGFSQVIFQVQAPSTPTNLQGTYPLTWADPSGGDWATPDLNIPANSITGPLEFVNDGTAGNNPTFGFPLAEQACADFGVATQPLAGKIAVLYRADCQFGFKAAVAENAGAIGVIIINHTGPAVGMAGGDSGLVVTIPVIMISQQDGAALEAAIHAGTITDGFIGNKFGIFADDLGAGNGDVLRARRFSNLAALSQNASEFSVPVGAWVRNFGNQSQTGATLTATIDNGTQIYNNNAVVPTLAPGDSVFVSLPLFSQPSYTPGYYTMEYTIATNPNADGEPSDNVINADFMISDSLYSYGRLDAVTNEPLSPSGFQSGNFTTDWEGCFAFQDPNASRGSALGMTFSATSTSTAILTNQFVEARLYQWDDVFADNSDANLGFASLLQLDAAFYVYTTDAQDSNIYVPFTQAWPLVDNQRYLFCINSTSADVFIGYDTQVDYLTTQDDVANGGHNQPSTPGSSDATYFLNGFGLDVQAALSVKMDFSTGVDENNANASITPFPNPVIDVISIPVGKRNGKAVLEVFDVTGKLVLTQDVRFDNNDILKVNVSNIDNGLYVFNMTFENGTTSNFNVVVNR